MKPETVFLSVSIFLLPLAVLSLAYGCPLACMFFALISGSLASAWLWTRGLP